MSAFNVGLLLIAGAVFLLYRGERGAAAGVAVFGLIGLLVDLPSRGAVATPTPPVAAEPAKEKDPGPNSLKETAFEIAAQACGTNATCLKLAFETAFASTCDERVRAAMFYDYRFQEGEPLFVSAAATADLRFQAQGSSLFAQSAGNPAYRRQIWFCEATRREPGGHKRADYFVSVKVY